MRPRVDLVAIMPYPYKPLGVLAGPLPHRQETFYFSIKSWGQIYIFSQPSRLEAPNSFKTTSLSCMMSNASKQPLHYHLRFIQMLMDFSFAHSQATTIPGCCLRTTLHSNCQISQLTLPLEVFLSILESTRHKLFIADGLTLVTSSLCGWQAFSTFKALTDTRSTWALSPTVPQVSGVTMGSPFYPYCFGHSSCRIT